MNGGKTVLFFIIFDEEFVLSFGAHLALKTAKRTLCTICILALPIHFVNKRFYKLFCIIGHVSGKSNLLKSILGSSWPLYNINWMTFAFNDKKAGVQSYTVKACTTGKAKHIALINRQIRHFNIPAYIVPVKPDIHPYKKQVSMTKTITITHCRPPRGTVKMSYITITKYQEDKVKQTALSLFPIKVIAKLEKTHSNIQQSMEQTHTPPWEQQSTTNQQQQNHCLRTDKPSLVFVWKNNIVRTVI